MLTDGRAGRCEIEDRTAIAAETTRRLCCDVGIVLVVDGTNGEPLSVGRRTRCIPYDKVPMFAMAWWDSGDAPPKTGSRPEFVKKEFGMAVRCGQSPV